MLRFSAFFLSLFLVSQVLATVLTVNHSTQTAGEYLTLAEAYTAAQPGDTLYVVPHPQTYGGLHCYKQLTIIGGGWGYDLAEDGLCNSKISSFYFDEGSDGSVVCGVKIYLWKINVSNVLIANCHCCNNDFSIDTPASNITLSKCKIYSLDINEGCFDICIDRSLLYGRNHYSLHDAAALFFADNSGGAISNCLFQISHSISGSLCGMKIESDADVIVFNNTFYVDNTTTYQEYSVYASGYVIATNNLFLSRPSGSMTYWIYNMSTVGYLPEGTTNINTDQQVVMDAENGDFHLCAGSPAIGAGENGVDIGAYGGVAPFDDDYAIPSLPTITQLLTPATIVPADEPVQVNIKAQINQ